MSIFDKFFVLVLVTPVFLTYWNAPWDKYRTRDSALARFLWPPAILRTVEDAWFETRRFRYQLWIWGAVAFASTTVYFTQP